MGFSVATTRVACDTSTGDQTITTSDLGGLTPTGAVFICTAATADGTATDHAILSVGFASGATERFVATTSDEHNQATTDSYRRMAEDEVVIMLEPTDGTVEGEADFKEFVSNGCTITWGNALDSAYLLTVIFFAGTSSSCHVDTFTSSGTDDDTVDVTDPGFEPDFVLVLSTRSAINDTSGASFAWSFGCAVNTVGSENFSINVSGADNQATVANASNSRSNLSVFNIFRNNTFAGAEIDGWDSSGFTVNTRDGDGSNSCGYIAVATGAGVYLGDASSPTSTGDDAISGVGFTPQAVIYGLGHDPSFSATEVGNRQIDVFSCGVGVATSTAEYSNVVTSEDGVATSNTQSLSDDTLINQQPDGGGTTDDVIASLSSFDVDGWTPNYSAVDTGSAYAFWALAIEEDTGRSTRNTDASPLGIHTAMGWRVNTP